MAYARNLRITHHWNGTLRTGNPVKSDLVTQYMAFVREKQKKAGNLKYHKHLLCFTATSRQSPHTWHFAYGACRLLDRTVLARNRDLFTVAFGTRERRHGLSFTRIQRLLRLPNEYGFLFDFQWGKTMWDGADHLMAVEYSTNWMATCGMRAFEQYIGVGTALGWNITEEYIFLRTAEHGNTH